MRKEHETVNQKLADKTTAHKSLQEEHAKLNKAHQEAVQKSVAARMSMRKLEESLAKKTSEAVAEQSKAAESGRLLASLRKDFNESSLKSTSLSADPVVLAVQRADSLAIHVSVSACALKRPKVHSWSSVHVINARQLP